MQHLFRSVRRSLVFRNSSTADNNDAGFGDLFDKIGSSIRKSRSKSPVRRGLHSSSPAKENMPPAATKEKDEDDMPHIRWRRGELIGPGAFGRVYKWTNLDTGELLAVTQVLIAVNAASKEKAQAHIRELEKEVELLKNLSHVNIVRYLGTAREEDALNILMEFVPGGSITSHLGMSGSFPEPVIRRYTKQLLVGLQYLHKNGIIHRDIKGANILVDNKGCIKLAHFGASTKVVELATMTGAKSMKGTPHWMAPEVIHQTEHNFSADIWSVGCTVIEMATGKPPWSQYEGMTLRSTNSPPPIPEHLSEEAKDLLHKCLQKEPNARASASELLQHPFVMGEYRASQTDLLLSVMAFDLKVLHEGVLNNTLSMSAKSMKETIWKEELERELEMARARAPTAATAPPKGLGMKLGKGGQKTNQFLESLKAEGEMIVEDVPPTLSKSKAAAPPLTDAVTLTVEEKLNVTLKRDGGLSNFDVQGTLSLQILEEKDAYLQVEVESGGNPSVLFKTHPNINKERFSNENILGLKDPNRPFPTGQGDGVGLLKWRMQRMDESVVPLTINCWPSISGGETYVSMEYEASPTFDLQNVVVSVPIPALREAPNVTQIEGEWRYDSRNSILEWSIVLIDNSNRSGAMEFVVPTADPSSFFSISVRHCYQDIQRLEGR